MTIEQINNFIYNKQIPLSFVWEDGKKYYMDLFFEESNTTSNKRFKGFVFPNWGDCYFNITLIKYKDNELIATIFESEKETMEECISEFLYWFEVNKSRCKTIQYYQK